MKNLRSFQILMLSMYVTGFIGLRIQGIESYMKLFTPLHLLASILVLLYFHQDWSKSFKIWCISTLLIGFLIEIVGVATGQIFGIYHYGNTLGLKIFNVPVIIATNWLFLSYCIGTVTNELKINAWLKIIFSALLMTAIDFITEPVAVHLDMWHWEGGQVPMQNYVAWFLISLPIFYLFFKSSFKKENLIAFWLLLLNTLFFGLGAL
jgi:putative membrane protein